MKKEHSGKPKPRPSLHPRNRHQGRYDFEALVAACPDLKSFLKKNPRGETTVNFMDPLAVQCLNKALLFSFYGLEYWEFPQGYLCPPVPGRSDYIHHVADLLQKSLGRKEVPKASVMDIGTGSSLIYPIIGCCEYDWQFVGTETDREALDSAWKIKDRNPALTDSIFLRPQSQYGRMFDSVLRRQDRFDLVVCNPPFFASEEEAREANARKWRNLRKGKKGSVKFNFGGNAQELWCPGGEKVFIRKMIKESQRYREQVLWFTTLVSKGENLPHLKQVLRSSGVEEVAVLDMGQGQKQSRVLCWTFWTPEGMAKWQRKPL